MRVIIATGTGRYADPWHPFRATSDAVATILIGSGYEVEVKDVDEAMQSLEEADLLIVDAGDPWRSGGVPGGIPPASTAGFSTALKRGIGLLSLHAGVSSLRDFTEWAPAVGAVWIPSVSMHPPAGAAHITIRDHAVTEGMTDFEVLDGRYCFLQLLGARETLAEHVHEQMSFPTAWIRTHGESRVACSLLGHDERSYESAGNRELLRRLAHWASAGGTPPWT